MQPSTKDLLYTFDGITLNISNSKKILMTLIKSSNAIIAYEGRLTAVVKVILNNVVSSGTYTNYSNK